MGIRISAGVQRRRLEMVRLVRVNTQGGGQTQPEGALVAVEVTASRGHIPNS